MGHNLSALTGLRHVQEAGATFACGRDAIRTIRDPSFTIFPTGSHTDNNHVDKSWRVELVYKRGHWGRTGFGLGRIPVNTGGTTSPASPLASRCPIAAPGARTKNCGPAQQVGTTVALTAEC